MKKAEDATMDEACEKYCRYESISDLLFATAILDSAFEVSEGEDGDLSFMETERESGMPVGGLDESEAIERITEGVELQAQGVLFNLESMKELEIKPSAETVDRLREGLVLGLELLKLR